MNKLATSNTDFPKFCRSIKQSAAALDEQEKVDVRSKADSLLQEFQSELAKTTPDEVEQLHRRFVAELAYALLKIVGQGGLITLTAGQ